MGNARPTNTRIPAIRVHQWLPDWDKVKYKPNEFRGKPEPFFYMFSLPAPHLRALSGIYRRSVSSGLLRSSDLGIQRQHEKDRSDAIREYVEFGYPWSELKAHDRESDKFYDLRKPGWLPTAIVVNILRVGDSRHGKTLSNSDSIHLDEDGDGLHVRLPTSFTGSSWVPSAIPPIEVIDGQHRLWAFSENGFEGYDLPVVAFYGLDISWQAYLFWTINIKPKRINPSLAFDLYPLLRAEEWLERYEGHVIYRETRAQELTEALWSHTKSPWKNRINMLGEPGSKFVTQAAWIRSLVATFVKSFEGRGVTIGGLFGSKVGHDKEVLGWPRFQQAAFLIYAWSCLRDAISISSAEWAKDLRQYSKNQSLDDAFYGTYSLLTSDPGVRGILSVLNDLTYVITDKLHLSEWIVEEPETDDINVKIDAALSSIEGTRLGEYLQSMAQALASFDWRAASTPNLSEEQRTYKLVFRGSGGYREIRRQLLNHLVKDCDMISEAASIVKKSLNL